jgi:hypothetical protein
LRALIAGLAALSVAAAPAAAQEEIDDPLDRPSGAGPPPAPPPLPPVARVSASIAGYAWSQLEIDTRLDNGREAAGAWRNHAYLRLGASTGPRLRAVASARLRTWSTVERNEDTAPFLFVNGEGWRSGFEVVPGDAFVELLPAEALRVRIGLMTFGWGHADILSPADPLNPRDLRWGLPVEPSEVAIPVLAVDAGVALGSAHLELVWLPFFTESRGWLIGQDHALFSPGGAELPLDLRGALPDALTDGLQAGLVSGLAPEPAPAHGSLAARVSGRIAGVDLAVGYLFGWDPLPTVRVDPDLGQLLVEAASPDPRLLEISTILARLGPRLAAGERLAEGGHRRQHKVFGEAGAAVGDLVLKLDAALASDQTYYTSAPGEPLAPVRHPTVAVAAGVDWRLGQRLLAGVQWLGVRLLGAGDDEPLLFVEPTLHVVSLLARAMILPGHLDAQVAAVASLTQGDWLLQPTITWRAHPRLSLTAGASIWQGTGRSAGGFYDHTDAAFVRARTAF